MGWALTIELQRVTVRCRGVILNLDVDHGTSVLDIIVAFSNQIALQIDAGETYSQSINVDTCMAVEAFTQLGLKRRLRRYERVWDIMNSWDQDMQNMLIILPDIPEVDMDLDLASVPHEPPAGSVLTLYHSRQPGKWNKRFITLEDDGQILSKKSRPLLADKSMKRLCHLSDYDVYLPIEAQMKKQLKPPKKYCYAIKSQQKMTVFMDPTNYVHFFCTDDPDVAQRLHSFVHGWRSWYLANMKLQLHSKRDRVSEKPPQIVMVNHMSERSSSLSARKAKFSIEETIYPSTNLKPVVDPKRFHRPFGKLVRDPTPDASKQPTVPSISLLEESKAGTMEKDTSMSSSKNNEAAFAADGLLGNVYQERKQAQIEEDRKKQAAPNPADNPFTTGPSLLSRLSLGASLASPDFLEGPLKSSSSEMKGPDKTEPSSSWFPSALEHSAKQRVVEAPVRRLSTSSGRSYYTDRDREQRRYQQQQRNGPLVNLTPSFVEAQQWSRDGLGRGVRAPHGIPLVDLATGPVLPPGSRNLEGPPRNLVRRDAHSASYPPQRPSTSDGRLMRRPTFSGDSWQNNRPNLPPMPPLPISQGAFVREGTVYDRHSGGPPPPRSDGYRPSTSGGGHGYASSTYSHRPSTSGGGQGYASSIHSHRPNTSSGGGGPGYPASIKSHHSAYSPPNPADRAHSSSDPRQRDIPPRYNRDRSGSFRQ
ncbi:hypothetical protein B0T26DRAFT_149547 [Lasiosphaeria miniovina]|uniref:PH domain-containing protein n=1 Tax=Lasiosphaeria miniovina TaxID=1954250 RepID=A0AA40B5D3_9PEZI|nr:uncharacterized protein B0T26DRAFT_149547 [Lasiosphaeria miniovina]KAK0727918.1 hypothetical protein B0T26DRAFT_149547 [Lasiosphaeria miniovina]